MAKKSGLGKGLDALIVDRVGENTREPEKAAPSADNTLVDISRVEPDKEQPRKKFDEDSLQELADSIRQYGIIEPLIVQDKKDYFKIVAGERRWRAAKIAGLKEVPVIVKDLTDKEVVEISLIENIQREDLNPIEEAAALKRLIDEFGLKQDEVAERISKSRTAISNSMRLLKLDPRVQQMLIDEKLTTGHARALLAIEDGEEQYALAERIFDEKLNVREVEKLIKKLGQEKKKPDNKAKDPQHFQMETVYQGLEDRLKNALGTKVTINAKDSSNGVIAIEYYSADELDALVDGLCSITR